MLRLLSVAQAKAYLPKEIELRDDTGVILFDEEEAATPEELESMFWLYSRYMKEFFWLSARDESQVNLPLGGAFHNTGVLLHDKYIYVLC